MWSDGIDIIEVLHTVWLIYSSELPRKAVANAIYLHVFQDDTETREAKDFVQGHTATKWWSHSSALSNLTWPCPLVTMLLATCQCMCSARCFPVLGECVGAR